MSGVVIHFGVDSSYHLPLLQDAGLEVVDCGTSLPDFDRAISDHEVCAIVVTQNASYERVTLKELRSRSSAPVILFASLGAPARRADVDLVIPALTAPPAWLTQVAELLKKSREIAERSASIRRQSAPVRQQSATLRAQSASERERCIAERSKASRSVNPKKTEDNLP